MTESERFEIARPSFDRATATARLDYRLGDLAFTETLVFPAVPAEWQPTEAFERLLEITALVLGVSYFKLRAPLTIALPGIPLDEDTRAFLLDIYENGLGEFYARNNLQRYGRLTIEAPVDTRPAPSAPPLRQCVLVPVGGGKDSLVSVELLEAAGIDFTPFSVNPKGPILGSVAAIGRPAIYVARTLDPAMIELGTQPGYYNGHVPSTAINSMIAALAALLFDYDAIALSNERSASEGNVEFDGRQANHQYSKSLDFEARISAILAGATGGALGYFSLLRPFSEARIARLFARQTRFDHVFSSCNRNFRLSGHDGPLWCGKCPKCHFVFLVLAPAMDKQRLLGIFGRDLLDDPANERSFRELTGLAGQKPWECVGEIAEAAACLDILGKRPAWSRTAIVAALREDLLNQYGEERLADEREALFEDSAEHLIPPDFAMKVFANAL